jgi:hypothetical protein
VAMYVASPMTAWRSLDRTRIKDVISCEVSWEMSRGWSPGACVRESNRERAIAASKEVEVHDSTATYIFALLV